MTILKYKDFQGSVVYSDGSLVIQILHIDDFITTECSDAGQADAAFKGLVEDYLETCKIVGKNPCRPFKGTFNVRITPELHRQAAMTAATENMTLNAWVSSAIEATISNNANQNKIAAEILLSRRISEQNISYRNLYNTLYISEKKQSSLHSASYDALQNERIRRDILVPDKRSKRNEYGGH